MSAKHVRFRVGDERYALPVEQVLEVADVGQVAPVPGAPEPVLGVRNLRAQVLPVIDLAVLFGLKHAREGGGLLIVEGNGRRAGLFIDEVSEVGELPEKTEETEGDFLTGAVHAGDGLVGLIDLEAVFAAVEARAAA